MITTKNIIFFISLIIRISLIGAIIIAGFERQWFVLFVSTLTLFLSFFPALLKRNYKITFPVEFEFLILFFIYGTLFLGEVGDFYNIYWWWDIMLHGLSAMILAVIGLLLIDFLNRDTKADIHLSPFFVALFSFTFALSIGALWEIFEFAMDTIFGTNMLKSGLVDTFGDLIVDTIGALIISASGYFYAKRHNVSIVEKAVKTLIRKSKS